MARRDALRLGLSRPGLLEEAFGRRDHRSRHYQSAARIVGRLARSVEILVSVPCVIFEDDHLLAVNKPAGLNTHAPAPHAGEGIYDWLRHREPRWATLAIIHRLDKETSGVIVFSKTPRANRSLTEQLTKRSVRKRYVLLTDREIHEKEFTIRSCLVRAGERYVSRPVHAGGDVAETRFKVIGDINTEAREKIQDPTSKIQR